MELCTMCKYPAQCQCGTEQVIVLIKQYTYEIDSTIGFSQNLTSIGVW